jgi:hypothetical protein
VKYHGKSPLSNEYAFNKGEQQVKTGVFGGGYLKKGRVNGKPKGW